MGNALKNFNIPIGRMPKLSKLSLDWFSFLVPSLPQLAVRASHFNIDKVLSDRFLSSKSTNHKSFESKKKKPYAPQKQQQSTGNTQNYQRKIDNNQHYTQKVSGFETSQYRKDEILSNRTSLMDEDEAQLLIASERNHTLKQENNTSAIKLKNHIGPTANTAYLTPFSGKSCDVFLELAILVE